MTLRLDPFVYRATAGRTIDAERGTLEVPMRRSDPGRGRVTLAFVRLPSTAAHPGDPIVFLTGGPGLSAIRAGRGRLFAFFDALRAVADVLLLDQRGTGESTPLLTCREPLRVAWDARMNRDDYLRRADRTLRACVADLAGDGVDLGAFNTVESADDVADLVRALPSGADARVALASGADARVAPASGAETRVALLGWSYGTHLAMTILKRHPSLVSRAVLAGPEGPDHTYKLPSAVDAHLRLLTDRVSADDRLRGRIPDLAATVRAALERVEREPVRVTVRDAGANALAVPLSRFELEWITAESLADVRFLRGMPVWYERMARGEFADFEHERLLAGPLLELRAGLVDSALRFCVDCASGASASRRGRIARETIGTLLGNTIDFPFPDICAAAGSPDLGDAFRVSPRVDTPTLFITGALDCRTPAANVADLAPGFARHAHVIADDVGHADLLLPSAVQRTIVRYLQNGDVEHERVAADEAFRFEAGDTTPAGSSRPMLIYDGECAFCRAQVDRIRARTAGAVDPVPLNDAPAHGVAIDPRDLRRAVHFIARDGRVTRGAEAILEALSAGRRSPHPVLYLYRRIPAVAWVAERVYGRVARWRSRL